MSALRSTLLWLTDTLQKKEKEQAKPKEIYIAFLYGNFWAYAERFEDLKLGTLSAKDPRVKVKKFVEVT
jgi:hypothetical protein